MRRAEFIQECISKINPKKSEIIKVAEYSAGVYDAMADACINKDALKTFTDNYIKSSKEVKKWDGTGLKNTIMESLKPLI